MSGLLPSDSDVDPPEGEPRVLGVDSDDADQVLAALSSSTARTVLATLHDEPATPTQVADRVGTSLQNAQYHIGNLEDADLVQIADIRYSSKGREMNVYAPSDGPLVLFAGSEDDSRSVQSALASLLGGVGALGVASLAVQRLLGGASTEAGGGPATGAAETGTATTGDGEAAFAAAEATTTEAAEALTSATTTVEETATAATDLDAGAAAKTTTTAVQTAADAATTAEQAAGLPPGLLFFAGGLAGLALVAGWWYLRN